MSLTAALDDPQSPIRQFYTSRWNSESMARLMGGLNDQLGALVVDEVADPVAVRLMFDIWMRWQFEACFPSDTFGWNAAEDTDAYSKSVWYGNVRPNERFRRAAEMAQTEFPGLDTTAAEDESARLAAVFDKSLLAFRTMSYHPTFSASAHVGGCDADFQLDDALVFVITGAETIGDTLIMRLATCLILDCDDARRIRQCWLYFPHRATTLRLLTGRIISDLKKLRDDFFAHVPAVLLPGMDLRFHYRHHDLAYRYRPVSALRADRQSSELGKSRESN